MNNRYKYNKYQINSNNNIYSKSLTYVIPIFKKMNGISQNKWIKLEIKPNSKNLLIVTYQMKKIMKIKIMLIIMLIIVII